MGAKAVVRTLKALKADDSTENYKAAAEAIVRLRARTMYEGRPDWAGRSPEWRALIGSLYREAGVPPDSAGNLQAKLRYHVTQAVRGAATAEELRALGLCAEGPRDRARTTRSAGRANPLPTDSAGLAEQALKLVRAARRAGVTRESTAILVKVIKEATNALGTPRPPAHPEADGGPVPR